MQYLYEVLGKYFKTVVLNVLTVLGLPPFGALGNLTFYIFIFDFCVFGYRIEVNFSLGIKIYAMLWSALQYFKVTHTGGTSGVKPLTTISWNKDHIFYLILQTRIIY